MRFVLAGLLALGLFAVTAAQAVEINDLVAKLSNKDAEVRRTAAKELAEMGGEARAAVPALTKALRDKDRFVRRFSAEALGSIGPDARSAVGQLTLAMSDEKKEVGLAAVEALSKLGPDAIKPLTGAIRDPNKDPMIRKKAALGLGKMGLQARGAVSALSDVLTGKIPNGTSKGKNDDDIRVEAATALGSVARAEDRAAIEALKSVAEGKQRNKALQKAAGDSLRQITGTPPARKKKKG
jgi:HEAT repeat protein